LTTSASNPLPAGLRIIAAIFAACSLYLFVLGLLMLVRPDAVGMSAGASLLFGLELAGPYMFLLMALVAGAIALGLICRFGPARHAAIFAAISGVVMLVPSVSGAVVMVQLKPLVIGGLGVIVRVIIASYLWRQDTADEFRRRA
jgi:hypothetical protein